MRQPRTSRRTESRSGRGFTLLEIMMVIVVIAIATLAILPTAGGDQPLSLQSASSMLASDIEFAQASSVADPSDPVVLVFGNKGDSYWLARASAPETPIDKPGAASGTKYEVHLEDLGLVGSSLTVEGVGLYIRFDAMGRLAQGSDILATLASPAGRIEVSIDAATGSVSLTPDGGSTAAVSESVFGADQLAALEAAEDAAAVPEAPAQPRSQATQGVDALIDGTVTGTASTATATINGVVVGVTSAATSTTGTVTSTVTTVTETTTGTVGGIVGGLLGGGKR